MEKNEHSPRRPRISPTKPLHLRKKSNSQVETSKQPIRELQNGKSNASKFPPRTSSSFKDSMADLSDFHGMSQRHLRAAANSVQSPRTALSDCINTYFSVPPSGNTPSIAASHSTVSDIKGSCLSDSSSAIFGDFVQINKAELGIFSTAMSGLGLSDSPAHAVKITRTVNPYQFEPDTPEIVDANRHTHITDFMRKHESSPASFSSPRMAHFKNARSAGSAVDMGETLRPLAYEAQKSTPFRLQRCGSSPQIGTTGYPTWGGEEPSAEVPTFKDEFGSHDTASRQRQEMGKTAGPQRGRHYTKEYSSPTRRESHSRCYRDGQKYNSSSSTTGSSSAITSQTYNIETTPRTSPYDRYYTQSSTGYNQDGYKQDFHALHSADKSRFPIESPSPSPSPPKRSRSPMKRLFGNQTSSSLVSSRKLWGENGFFGESLPDGTISKESGPQNTIRSRAASNPANQSKRSGIITRVKNKLEEFADLTPKSNTRVSNGQFVNKPQLNISIAPPIQARIYMQLELSLHQTANSFLMAQVNQARMSLDSWKKHDELWKDKGRPSVREFMYNLEMQQKLVADNQHGFRFYGDAVGNNIRINAMLHSWRQVSRQLALRTFCDPDSVILKLICDVERILGTLGAVDSVMAGVQNLRIDVQKEISQKEQDIITSQTHEQDPLSVGVSSKYTDKPDIGHFNDPSRGPKLDRDRYS